MENEGFEVWRIHLTSEDVGRVKIAPGADPMWEIAHSVQAASSTVGAVVFDHWRRQFKTQVQGRWQVLRTLLPPVGYMPDFLTPAAGTINLTIGVESVLSTPKYELRHDLDRLGRQHRMPAWTGSLAAGDPETLKRLGTTLQGYFDEHLAPYWTNIHRQIDDELQRLRATMWSSGVEGTLATLPDPVRWETPVLTLTNKPSDREIYPNGAGLILQPSFFAFGDTTLLEYPGHPLVVVYSFRQQLGWSDTTYPEPAALRLPALLGRTRAAALELLGTHQRTTTELARGLGVSLAAASEHAAVLREAGLVISQRDGKRVIHHASDLGTALLNHNEIPQT